jgi:ELAV like protein 2/3/4
LVIRFADSHGKTRRSSKSERNLAALPGGGMNGGSGHGMTGLGGSIGNGLVDIPTRMGGGSDSRDNSFRGGSQHHPGVVSPGSALISLIANNAAAAGGSAHGPGTLDIASMLLARQNAVTAAALLQQQQANSQSGDGSFRGGNHNPFHPGSVDSASSFGDGSFRGGSNSFGGNSGFGGALNMLQQQQSQSGPNTNAGGVGGLSDVRGRHGHRGIAPSDAEHAGYNLRNRPADSERPGQRVGQVLPREQREGRKRLRTGEFLCV